MRRYGRCGKYAILVSLWLGVSGCSTDPNDLMIKAAANGDVQKVEECLDQGADVSYKDKKGKTAIGVAVRGNHVSVVRVLLIEGIKGSNPDSFLGDAQGAAIMGHVEVVREFLDAGIDVNAKNKYGQTLLHVASAEGQTEVVQELVDRGALIDARDSGGSTAVFHASGFGSPKVVKMLMAAGADVTIPDKYGYCAMDFALGAKNMDVVDLLRRVGAEPCR